MLKILNKVHIIPYSIHARLSDYFRGCHIPYTEKKLVGKNYKKHETALLVWVNIYMGSIYLNFS